MAAIDRYRSLFVSRKRFMSEVNVNSVKPSEVSDEMVALYLLASIAENEPGVGVNWHAGVPVIGGMNKQDLLANYVDCLKTITSRSVKIAS